MEHKEIRKTLSAFHDGELPRAEMLRVEKHLAGCAECSLELARLRAFDELLAPLACGAEDRAFAAEILERIADWQHAPAGERSPYSGWWKVPALALASFALYALYVETALLPSEADYLTAALSARNSTRDLSGLLLGDSRGGDAQILAMVLDGGNK